MDDPSTTDFVLKVLKEGAIITNSESEFQPVTVLLLNKLARGFNLERFLKSFCACPLVDLYEAIVKKPC